MLLFRDRSTQRLIIIACVLLPLLALPLMGMLHCPAAHLDHEPAATPLAEACCMFLCCAALAGLTILPLRWMMMARATPHLKPVRLTNHLSRWTPPPRSIWCLA